MKNLQNIPFDLQFMACIIECCEKYKSFKLKIPQPDSERRHSPDFRTVFGIMIGPFSSCEIGKTWGTNKQVNKKTNKNWNFQIPQPDLERRHSNELWDSPQHGCEMCSSKIITSFSPQLCFYEFNFFEKGKHYPFLYVIIGLAYESRITGNIIII